MLVIRTEQMRVLEGAVRTQAVKTHLQHALPDRWNAAMQSKPSLVEDAVARAGGYGFSIYRDIVDYCTLTLILGERFELEPEYAWVRAILKDRDPTRPDRRATRICHTVLRELREREQDR